MPTLYRFAVKIKPILYPMITFLLYAWTLLLLDQSYRAGKSATGGSRG